MTNAFLVVQVCENAERRWASKIIRGEETRTTPTLEAYLQAARSRQKEGRGSSFLGAV
jgi:hypothetical protein